MKTGILINVYNEKHWLEPVILSLIDHFDEIVITEGAYQIAINVDANPRSTDGTLDVLNKYKDRKNITILHENEFEQCNQLNKGLEILKNKEIDWLMVVDADEIWEENYINIAKNFMELAEQNGIYQYRVHFYNFINSFDRYDDAKLKRIFKVTPGCQFILRNENMEWPDHGKSVDVGTAAPHIAEFPQMFRVFHYSGIKPGKRWKLKQNYLIKRNGHPRFSRWQIDKNGILREEDDLKEFKGIHPKVVRETFLYKLWEKNPDLLREELFSERI